MRDFDLTFHGPALLLSSRATDNPNDLLDKWCCGWLDYAVSGPGPFARLSVMAFAEGKIMTQELSDYGNSSYSDSAGDGDRV